MSTATDNDNDDNDNDDDVTGGCHVASDKSSNLHGQFNGKHKT